MDLAKLFPFLKEAYKLDYSLILAAMLFQVITIISISEFYYYNLNYDSSVFTPEYIKFELWLGLEFVLFAANIFGYVFWLMMRTFTKDV